MLFLLVRDPLTGSLQHAEVLVEGDRMPRFEDPAWEEIESRKQAIAERFPTAELIEGMGSSIDAFLSDHPEFGPLLS